MISIATETDKAQITDITVRAGVLSQKELDSVPVMFDEYLEYETDDSGYHFIVYRERKQVLGYGVYGGVTWRNAPATYTESQLTRTPTAKSLTGAESG